MSLTNSPFWFSSGATSAGGGGNVVYPYSINQSLRFNDADDHYLNRVASTGDRQKWTWSGWVKRGNLGTLQAIFSEGTTGSSFALYFNSTDTLFAQERNSSSNRFQHITSAVFRDVGAWYHIVYAVDTTQAIDSERVNLYVNGQIQTLAAVSGSIYPSLDLSTNMNVSGRNNSIGYAATNSFKCLDGYLAEVNFIDGTALDATSFGEDNNGVWVPKAYNTADGAYGTNGYYLTFSSDSFTDNGSDPDVFADQAGSNNYDAYNISASDIILDSPTNSFCVWNTLDKYAYNAPSEGNLRALTAGNNGTQNSTFAVSSGKWYWEARNITAGSGSVVRFIGIAQEDTRISLTPYTNADCYLYYAGTGNIYNGGNQGSYGDTWGAIGDIIGVAFDADTGAIWFSKNGTWQNSATAAEIAAGTTTNAAFTGLSGTFVMMVSKTGGTSSNDPHHANFGQDSTFAGDATTGSANAADDNGIGDFYYTPPSGFLALAASSLPEPAIGPQQASGQQADNYFETMLYTGNGAVQHIGSGGAQHPINVTTIDNSLRFNNSDSSFLSYQPGDNGDTQKMTYSGWIKRTNTSKYQMLLQAVDSQYDSIWIEPTNNKLQVILGSTSTAIVQTNITFIDTSKWYHICVNVDTTQATDTDRIKIWVDGDLQTLDTSGGGYPTQNAVFAAWFKSNITHRINFEGGSTYGSGYFAEVHVAEGTTYDMDNFGQYGSNGYWIPKTVSGITYGDEGFYLDFSDNSTASALGTDSSGNTNNFSATNIATTDQTGDSPTQNFNTLDPSRSGTDDLSEGNLLFTEGNGLQRQTVSTFFIPNIESSTLWYVECKPDNGYSFGIGPEATATGAGNTTSHTGFITYYSNGSLYLDTSSSAYGASYNETNLLSMVIGNGQIEFFKDNVSQGVALTGLTGDYRVVSWAAGSAGEGIAFNFGQDDSFCGYRTPSNGSQAADANGYGSFYYTPPTGSLAIVDDNIPQEGIASPDFVWIKNRSRASISNVLQDSVRGIGDNGINFNTLISDTTGAEFNQSDADGVSSLDANGFTVGYTNSNAWNNSGDTYAAWTWKAGGKANTFNIDGTGYATIAASPISDGTIALTGLSANTTSGFSIASYTGTGSNGTIAHGLSEAPELIIVKNRDDTSNWPVYSKFIGAANRLYLDLTNGSGAASTLWNSTAATNQVFSVGTSNLSNGNTDEMIAYCFHSVDGFSKVGSYVGNGSSDGTFVYTGFRPAFVLTKEASSTSGWNLRDNKRSPENVVNEALQADTNGTELTSGYDVDFLSNGFKLRTSLSDSNTSGQTYIYLAFAEQPFKYANAR